MTLALLFMGLSAATATAAAIPVVETPADLIDLTLSSPAIVQATIHKADKVNAKQAPGLRPGQTRFLVEADVTALLRSPEAVPSRIQYLWDAAPDARGKTAKVSKGAVLLFLAPSDRPGRYRLSNAQGQIAPTATTLATVRTVLADTRRPEMQGLRVTGVGNAFRVPGSLPGEAESQIFLTTADSRPVSVVVLSRPGQRRSYSVATGDVIDDAAKPIKTGTLLWYELACRLPRALPEAATANVEPAEREAVDDDYRFVLGELGACSRTLG